MTKHTNERCIHVQNCEICLDNDEAGGEKKRAEFLVHFRAFPVPSSSCGVQRDKWVM